MSLPNNIRILNEAIYKKDMKTINKIFLNAPNLLKCDDWSFLPLMNAILLDDEKLVKILIKHDVDVNYRNPLRLALEKASLRCIKILLENGASPTNPEWKTKSDWKEVSPAEIVFNRTNKPDDRREILKLLLKHGLDISFHNMIGDNLLHILCGFEIEQTDDDAVEVARILLDAGVPINEIGSGGYTLLESSIELKNNKLVSFLIDRGAYMGTELMAIAGMTENLDVIDLLVSSGADINATNDDGDSALHWGCRHNNEKLINILIRKGINVNMVNYDGLCAFSGIKADQDDYEKCIIAMVKEFSKLNFENLTVSKQNINLIQANSKARKHFKLCKKELSEMSSTKFYSSISYYSLLKMSISIKRLSNFTKNAKLAEKFESYLKNLCFYKIDLQSIWEEAVQVRAQADEVVSRLLSVFGDFFPKLVVTKLADNLTLGDLPLQ